MTRKNKTIINISLSLALVCALLLSMNGFASACSEMQSNIIRIRVIANSDSARDQALKLAVRDAVLQSSNELFSGTESYSDAVLMAEDNLEFFKECAERAVYAEGFDYPVFVRMGNEFFDTREYDDFTLPAGEYKTLVFTIGEGRGENWWCVMFPKVCVGACSGKLTDTVSESSANYAQNGSKYVLKFKLVEVFRKFTKII